MSLIGPGSTIGILGAGQLGRMLAVKARQMGYFVAVYGGDPMSPCGQVSDHCFDAPLDNVEQLRKFAQLCDVVTYEFENIPAAAAEIVSSCTKLCPGSNLLMTAQNRYSEKTTFQKLGLATPQFRMVNSGSQLETARSEFGGDVILKANTEGYDGRGQWRVDHEADCTAVWEQTGLTEAIVEERIDFEFELSIVAGRYQHGQCDFFPPFLNDHSNHILDLTVVHSSKISQHIADEAREMARVILNHFDTTGVLCLELFLTQDQRLLVNEIAPRPHNSGHLTIEAANCSQFELQLRTICDLPAVDLKVQPAAMINLLGKHLPQNWTAANLSEMNNPQTQLHLYGKTGSATNRKMGHLTAISSQNLEDTAIAFSDASEEAAQIASVARMQLLQDN